MSEAIESTGESTGSSRFRKFQEMLAAAQSDPEEAARFNAMVNSPATLIAYSASKGVSISEAEAEGIFAAARDLAQSRLETLQGTDRTLDDSELDNVNGGVSWAAIGGTIGVIAGVALGTAAAPLLVPGAVALQSAAFIGMAAGGAAAGGLSGGVWGAAIGGAAQSIASLFKD